MRFAVVCLLLLTPNLLLAEATKEEIPTVSELTEGILAFNCYKIADNFFPIILTEDARGWTAIGNPDIDIIRKVDNGFAFKSSKDDLLLAFLKEEGDNWQLEYFDEDGLNAAKCLEADEFAETIIEVIAPKIFDNANSLSSQLKLTQQELADEIARGEQALADEVSFREEKVNELQKRADELALLNEMLTLNVGYKKLSAAVMGGERELVGLFLEQVATLELKERLELISQRFNGLKEGNYQEYNCFNQLSYTPTAFRSTCKEMFIQHWLKK